MNAATLTQFLIDITRGHRKGEFTADAEGVLAASSLAEPLRRAIREQDVGTLWQAGAHPMALLYFARSCGWQNDRYYACLANSELRKDGGAEAAPSPAPSPAPPRTHR